MTDATNRPTRTEPGPIGWYWATSEDGGPLYGPYDTKAQAVDEWLADHGDDLRFDLEQEGEIPQPITDETLRSLCPHVARYRKPMISAEIFDADQILEQMEEHNEFAVWGDEPVDVPPHLKPALERHLKPALERHLAAALYAFFDQHNLWSEFRALDHMGDAE